MTMTTTHPHVDRHSRTRCGVDVRLALDERFEADAPRGVDCRDTGGGGDGLRQLREAAPVEGQARVHG